MKIFGNNQYDIDVYKLDKKNCEKIENCGVGDKAVFLGNYFFSNVYAFDIRCIKRVFKRVAMSKGGMTGKGIFATLSYVVVQYDNDLMFSCRLKREENVDLLLTKIKEKFPQIKTMSEKAEIALKKRDEEREKRKVKNLSDTAKSQLSVLNRIKNKVDDNINISNELCKAAKQKRAFMINGNAYGYLALILTILGLLSCIYGIYVIITGGEFGTYFVLIGFAAVFFFASLNIFPTKKNNKKAIFERYEKAKKEIENLLANENELTIPAKYSVSEILKYLIINIEEGKAETISDSLEEFKKYLKSLNKEIVVEQDEYEDIVKIKPIFLVENYL